MTKYWLHAVSIPNWDLEVANNKFLLGMTERWKGVADRINNGDFVAYYLTRRPNPKDPRATMISGIFQVTTDSYYDKTPIWQDDIYPYRADLEPLVIVEDVERMVPLKSMVQNISTIVNKRKWGGYLRRPMLEITEDDFEVIRTELEKKASEEEGTPSLPQTHECIEWALLYLGKHSGFDSWLTRNDRNRSCDSIRLGNLSLEDLPPLRLTEEDLKNIATIDVLWIKENAVIAAFEVEHTTNIQSGLTRLNDLVESIRYLTIQLFVVAPDERRNQVARQVSRPTYRTLQGKVRFIPYSTIQREVSNAKDILKLGGTLPETFLIKHSEQM
ncbi:MAG: EVE domain-containing protein [Candidatus Thorarchaeota archaeon]